MTKVGIQCPKCQKRYQVTPETIGKRVKCAGCATAFVAVQQAAAAPAPKPAGPAPAAAATPDPPRAALVARKPDLPVAKIIPPRRAAPPTVAPSSLDDLLGESFSPVAGQLASGPSLSSGPALSAGLNLANRAAPKRKLAIQQGTLIKVILIAVASVAGLVGVILAMPLIWPDASTAGSSVPTFSPNMVPSTAPVPPSSPASSPPPAAPRVAPPPLPPVVSSPPANTPPQPTEYENNCRELLKVLRQMGDLMASIRDRPSAQTAIPQIVPVDERFKVLLRKIEYTEKHHQQTPRDNQVAGELLPDIQAQVARVNTEAVRLRSLSVQLKMQDMMDRVTARRTFGAAANQPQPGQPATATKPGAGPRSHGPRPLPSHRPGRPPQ